MDRTHASQPLTTIDDLRKANEEMQKELDMLRLEKENWELKKQLGSLFPHQPYTPYSPPTYPAHPWYSDYRWHPPFTVWCQAP